MEISTPHIAFLTVGMKLKTQQWTGVINNLLKTLSKYIGVCTTSAWRQKTSGIDVKRRNYYVTVILCVQTQPGCELLKINKLGLTCQNMAKPRRAEDRGPKAESWSEVLGGAGS